MKYMNTVQLTKATATDGYELEPFRPATFDMELGGRKRTMARRSRHGPPGTPQMWPLRRGN